MKQDRCRDEFRMLQVTVALTSGRSASLSIAHSSKVGDLKALAQESFDKCFLKLVTAEGRILSHLAETLLAAGLQDGDQLTAIVGQARLAATQNAFALFAVDATELSPGEMQVGVVTALQSKIS